jgi:hypothetical protein
MVARIEWLDDLLYSDRLLLLLLSFLQAWMTDSRQSSQDLNSATLGEVKVQTVQNSVLSLFAKVEVE